MMLAGKRRAAEISFRVPGETLKPSSEVRYLGVNLEGRVIYAYHVRQVASRAAAAMRHLPD